MHKFHKHWYITKKDLENLDDYYLNEFDDDEEFDVDFGMETTYRVNIENEWFNLPNECEEFIKGDV